MIVIGLTIGFSRIYVGVHYPADVAAGAILGGAIAGILVFVAVLAGRKWKVLRLEAGEKSNHITDPSSRKA
jgi:undecaprenyl-diphosphatase